MQINPILSFSGLIKVKDSGKLFAIETDKITQMVEMQPVVHLDHSKSYITQICFDKDNECYIPCHINQVIEAYTKAAEDKAAVVDIVCKKA